ncbi:bcl-2-interacting killer isoform X2 [Nannospalax galili]|nr:bcl-2-interacting killer isoform X2 [Nannospalax galili]
MSETRPMARGLFIETLLQEQLLLPPVAPGAPGMTEPVGEEDLSPMEDLDLMECLEGSNQVALRLACIGDEMDLHLRSPHLTQLPGIAMHSLAVTYRQTGIRGVLRSLTHSLCSLGESIWSWRFLTPVIWVSPDQACRQLLPLVLLVLLLGGALHLLPQ